MPDHNRFAGLSEGLDEEAEAADAVESSSEDDAPAAEPDTVSTDTVVSEPEDSPSESQSESQSEAEAADESDDDGGPAFEFEETTAKSIYVREETLDVLEDTEFEVEMLLRREHGVRDVTGREFHDAAVRVLENHPEEVVDAILAARDDD